MASRCEQNHDLVVQMAAEGGTFAAIGRRIGTTHRRVSEYVRRHTIPYTPWTRDGAGNPHWQGGRVTEAGGYVKIKMPDHPMANKQGYVREHRLVMANHLGRALQPQEVVHHKDGNPSNNDLSNLELFGTNAEHLAETLAGKKPQWTAAGWAGMTAPRPRYAGRPTKSSLAASAPDGEMSR